MEDHKQPLAYCPWSKGFTRLVLAHSTTSLLLVGVVIGFILQALGF